MYTIDNLFDVRLVVGKKLEQLIKKRELTKSGICEKAGISRPTLDKLLSGDVTIKASFDKHVVKVLTALSITPTELMGGIENPFVDFNTLRTCLQLSLEEISKGSGVSEKDLQLLEAGERLPLAKIRDLAYFMGTTARGIQGTGFFQTVVDRSEFGIKQVNENIRQPGGYWGEVILKFKDMSEPEQHPITYYSSCLIQDNTQQGYLVIPCTDDTLLIINTRMVNEITLMDLTVADGEDNMSSTLPQIVYEVIDDYINSSDNNDISTKLRKYIDTLLSEEELDAEYLAERQYCVTVVYSDGNTSEYSIDNTDTFDFASDLSLLYQEHKLFDSQFIRIVDIDGVVHIVNLENVSLIKMSLKIAEDMIEQMNEEIRSELLGH